jgi:hypothetical protein
MKHRNVAFGLGLAAVASLGLGDAAQAQVPARAPVVVRAEQCLRQNVDHVVAVERDLESAANFLVNYACAAEVSGALRYQRNTAYVQVFSTIFKTVGQTAAVAGKPTPPAVDFKASVDPETGAMVSPPATPGAPTNPMTAIMPLMDGLFGQVAPETVPVDLRKLAGDLVLAARERQAKAR